MFILKNRDKIYVTVAIALTVLVIANICWWIKCAVSIESFEVAVTKYLSVFPSFLKNGRTITYLTLIICAISITISGLLMSRKRNSFIAIFFIINKWIYFNLELLVFNVKNK